jgi:NOL1/NOP2/fmu family ribosome biogenesis protein
MRANDGHRFGRLPASEADREVEGRPSREAVVGFWTDRYGIPPATWADYTFWERGAGKLWAFRGDIPSPVRIQGLGMTVLRTDGEHWKPTTTAAQRFGHIATECVVNLGDEEARAFLAGRDQDLPRWDGDWGYLIVTHELGGSPEPIGVGLYLHGELRSQIPKGTRREL